MTITLTLTHDEWVSLRLAVEHQLNRYDNINSVSPARNPLFYAEEIENCKAILRQFEAIAEEATS